VIQASQLGELTDLAWGVIAPLPPNESSWVPRVHDRRRLNGIFWVLRTAGVLAMLISYNISVTQSDLA
jgi:transposase